MEILNKLLEIIKSILFHFLNKKKEEKLEIINKIEEKKEEVEFQSNVEEVVKSANSDDKKEKQKALEEIRKLVSE